MSTALVQYASQNLTDILRNVFNHDDSSTALVIYDLHSPLSTVLTDAYRSALPKGSFINFHDTDTEVIMSQLETLKSGDFVALVQSTSFRLSAYRIRIELFKKKIKVAEHPHLGRMSEEKEIKHYVNALAYDTENTTAEFEAVLDLIKAEEDVVWVRELGLGLNRAFSKENFVTDMGTFERMCGLHLSLGAKHGIYAKEGMKRNSGKFHIDVMLDTDTFTIDDTVVFSDDRWVV